MKGFFGAFLVFLLWTSACIYYVSMRKVALPIIAEKTEVMITPENSSPPPQVSIISSNKETSTAVDSSLFDRKRNALLTKDTLGSSAIDREASLLLAEELQKSISISDTIDITTDEPELDFEKEIDIPTGPSFSSNLFYPRYNNTDLILDKELVAYASELKKLLKENPDKKVTILGHTDNVGSSKDNFSQGLKKARQIKWYLTARRGIPRRKITATSRGEEEPIATNKTVAGRRKNNRIEIIVD